MSSRKSHQNLPLKRFCLALFVTVALVCVFSFTGAPAIAGQPAAQKHFQVSLAQAEKLIDALYKGMKTARTKSLLSYNAYLAKHNYPGMYPSALACIYQQQRVTGVTLGIGVPDLNTVVLEDSNWVVPDPVGRATNLMTGKKPNGTTFVLNVTWPDGKSSNHVTILNGKAYYYLWFC